MSYSNQTLRFNAIAEAIVNEYRFVKMGTADDKVIQATAGAKILGISPDYIAAGKAIAPQTAGQAELILGGGITRGQKIKSDADGKGVYADTNKDEYGAVALRSGVAGDVIPVLIEKGQTNI